MSEQGFDAWWEDARQSWTAIEGDLVKHVAKLAYAAGQAELRAALVNLIKLYELPSDENGQKEPGQYYRAAKAALEGK